MQCLRRAQAALCHVLRMMHCVSSGLAAMDMQRLPVATHNLM
jgi:hypothetical protein